MKRSGSYLVAAHIARHAAAYNALMDVTDEDREILARLLERLMIACRGDLRTMRNAIGDYIERAQ